VQRKLAVIQKMFVEGKKETLQFSCVVVVELVRLAFKLLPLLDSQNVPAKVLANSFGTSEGMFASK
jgi:hypothetical protein